MRFGAGPDGVLGRTALKRFGEQRLECAMVWFAIAGVVGLFGLVTFLSGGLQLFKRRPISAFGRALVGSAAVGLGAVGGYTAWIFQSYFRMSEEQVVARLVVTQDQDAIDKTYNVKVIAMPNDDTQRREQDYTIIGDEVEFDVYSFCFNRLATTLLGADTIVEFDRLGGRYYEVEDEIANQDSRTLYDLAHTIHDNAPPDALLLSNVSSGVMNYILDLSILPPELAEGDEEFGQGIFEPLADGAEYEIVAGNACQLKALAINEEAEAAKEARRQYRLNRRSRP